jgi:hypothetical protein
MAIDTAMICWHRAESADWNLHIRSAERERERERSRMAFYLVSAEDG